MSSRVSNSSNTRKSRCTFCVNKGFSENVYSTHNVKNAQGKVTCIALLNHICSNCNRTGHTRGNCTVKNAASPTNDKMITVSVAFSKDGGKTVTKPLYCASISANRFAQLEVDDVQEDTKKSVSTTLAKSEKKTYAFVVAAVCQAPASAAASAAASATAASAAAAAAASAAAASAGAKPVIKKKYNWADVDSDSDDE